MEIKEMKGTEILDLLDLYHKATLALEGRHINREEWKLRVWDILEQLKGGRKVSN